ncbi:MULTISPECIES: hypothetical protein [Weeksella]|uniref:Uncharacterized protein n=1 Tax=Weeksella virosa (strain ATCC 43766 / DSM 16922 / JCM 21250 / CCUG 30538 / CDC 9751 / IAM 14551 / NBRC 16016 / NCTC 11634 / CL345/78) TaxID=865938 RepID=F0NYF1_WEEVC|nr:MULTISPECIES: hypothetical protein [Weeksella]ADX68148.1 hypothetical protein Weevi_1447 [Weeksella virosa DSM 16922]MDK7374868.1 hypothetical protein [Weeksella virosa]MDK7675489.1 hypothetical protein [Weeksella virosa]OFM83934.1 hypothetical protein HMPREF2660_10480 [Weeksella sp. HMSC059D05]SUP54459.1 Uncharacterised protein [Weeksella virosa]
MIKDRTILRNAIAVIIGLVVALVFITTAITFVATSYGWEVDGLIFDEWRHVVKNFARLSEANQERGFFWSLLISAGIGSMIGGTVTAVLVKRAKLAYAMLIGFILLLIGLLDIIFTPYHPFWYEIILLPVLFFFSWLGGKVVVVIYKKFFRYQKVL